MSPSSLCCPRCGQVLAVSAPIGQAETICCPHCQTEFLARTATADSDQPGEIYEATLASETPPSCVAVRAIVLVAGVAVIALTAGGYWAYKCWTADVAPAVNPAQTDKSPPQAPADGPSNTPDQQQPIFATNPPPPDPAEKVKGGVGLPGPPPIPPPPPVQLDPATAQEVIAEACQRLPGTWRTTAPYPITLTYHADGQVELTLQPSNAPPRQLRGRWQVREALNRFTAGVEWQIAGRTATLAVVLEPDGTIQHPIWGQTRVIPLFEKAK